MKRQDLVDNLEKLSRQLQAILNPAYVGGLISHEDLLTLSSAKYHLLSVWSKQEKLLLEEMEK